jgi:hypothetical protein
MTLDELDRWLDVYGRAWERKDLDGTLGCFAEGAVYQWGPWSEPLRWWVSMHVPAEGTIEEDEGIFLVTLGPDGRCTDFREWWDSRSRPAD